MTKYELHFYDVTQSGRGKHKNAQAVLDIGENLDIYLSQIHLHAGWPTRVIVYLFRSEKNEGHVVRDGK